MPNKYSITSVQQHTTTGKGSRRRLRLLAMIVLCFAAWAGATFWKQTDLIGAKLNQLEGIEQKLVETRQINERLKLEITRLNDAEYIEQKARKDFQMINDGETLFIAPDPKAD